MLFKPSYLRFVGSLFLIATLSVVSFGDTLRLKDGSIIKGKITGFGGGKFTVAIGDGARKKQMTFGANEIESIVFDAPQLNDTGDRNATYNPSVSDKPLMIPAKVVTDDQPVRQTSNPSRSTEPMKPIEWKVKVLADNTANGWTNSGWVVRKGQRIRVTGDGKISLGRGNSTSPAGSASLNDEQKLLKNVATGALIAVIGDDNNDFIYIGAEREFIATRDGALFLGINEGYLDDNSGSFNVKIEIIPEDVK
ncbi:MAG: LecA/PA-IL family lectin [Pyrinomonadaceae bacterium]